MNNNSRILVGAMIAAGAGAIIGMLFAPEKGSDLRKKIVSEIDELGESISLLADNLKSKVREFENDTARLRKDIQQAGKDTKTLIS